MNNTNIVVIDNTVTFVSKSGDRVEFGTLEPKSLVPYEVDCTIRGDYDGET